MKQKKFYFICFFCFIFPFFLSSDYIIPIEDPIYDYMERMYIQGYINDEFIHKPGYHDTFKELLEELILSNLPERLKTNVAYHYKRLFYSTNKKAVFAFYPLNNIIKSAKNIFSDYNDYNPLLYFDNEGIQLLINGLLGLQYDVHDSSDIHFFRNLQYYGLELRGNFYNNIGLLSSFRKGHYFGSINFIKDDPNAYVNESETSDEYQEWVKLITELHWQNKIMNISFGFGGFQIGKNSSSSIIQNFENSGYGYLKFQKEFGKFNFQLISGQLIPDSLTVISSYDSKSITNQTLTYSTNKFKIGIGQSVIYGDKSFDFGYFTPLVFFKLLDFKYHSRDNNIVYLFSSYRPIKGLLLYFNFLADDIKKSRLITKYWLDHLAFQGGFEYCSSLIPGSVNIECTVVGPKTYSHGSNLLAYTNDSQYLGYIYGSNLINISFQFRYDINNLQIIASCENIQQGSIANDPFKFVNKKVGFLSEELLRTQILGILINYQISSHLNLHLEYKYENSNNEIESFLYSGIELKY